MYCNLRAFALGIAMIHDAICVMTHRRAGQTGGHLPPHGPHRIPASHVLHGFATAGVILLLSGCSNGRHLSFLDPQGPIAAAERTHFLVAVGILVVFVALPIFLFLPWVLWRYRLGAKSSAYRPGWKANLPLEIFTWAGPVVIVIVLSVMVWHYAHQLDPYRPLATDGQAVPVQAIGYDWKWLFIYPKQGIATVGVLVIPVGQPIAMKLTSATVMQSLHIPALASQIYAMGGMITQLHLQASQPGRSLGENNMYNGAGFHKQRFTAIALAPAQFKAWVHKVKSTGVPMNADIYSAIAQQNTMDELTATLPRASHDGSVYLTDVSPDLFSAVIKKTKTNTPVALEHILPPPTQSSSEPPATSTALAMEQAP